MIEALASRLLRRRRPEQHKDAFPDQALERLAHAIAGFSRDHRSMETGTDHLQNLTGLLRTAAVIFRKEA
jgi:hypothetical protein